MLWRAAPAIWDESEIFHRKLNEFLTGLSNVVYIADDILVFGNNTEEHD